VKRRIPGQGRLIVGTVYLLHFSRPYLHARHYIGFTTDLKSRLSAHRGGRSTPLIRAAVAEGIELLLARTWDTVTVGFEHRLHKSKYRFMACPICSGPRALRWMLCRRNPVSGIGH
jgi:predicted GIY-YIG superfamily endonuclease